MVGDEPVAAEGTADLFIGHAGEDHVAIEGDVVALEQREHDGAHRRHVLHVDGPARPNIAVVDLGFEGRVSPSRGIGGHHVEVSPDEQRRFARVADSPDDDVPAPGRRHQDLGVEPLAPEVGGEVLGAGLLLPRGVRRVEAQELDEQRKRLAPRRLPVDGSKVSMLGHGGDLS